MHYPQYSEGSSVQTERRRGALDTVLVQRATACCKRRPARPFRNRDSASRLPDGWEGCWVGRDGAGRSDEVPRPLVLDGKADAWIASHGASLEVSVSWCSLGPILAYAMVDTISAA